jgi:signal transduction histidine kinase
MEHVFEGVGELLGTLCAERGYDHPYRPLFHPSFFLSPWLGKIYLYSLIFYFRLGSYFIVDPAVTDTLVGDYGRLQQVLINLAGNSLKFTNYPGEIVVVSIMLVFKNDF